MMRYFFAFICSFAFGIGLFFIPEVHRYLPKQEIHVFAEVYATNPALSHMIEFARLPQKTPKIIAWHRFPNRKNVLDLSAYNTIEVDVPAAEGYYSQGINIVLEFVSEIAKEYPHTVFVIHSNFSHIPVAVKPFIQTLPKERIKEIHLYEDGYGEILKWGKDLDKEIYRTITGTETQDALDGKIKWEAYHLFGFRHLYPTYYHFLNADLMPKIPHLQKLYEALKDNLFSINFNRLAQELTDNQKQIIYKLSGFDYEKFAPKMRHKKTIVFVTGFHFGNDFMMTSEERFLKELHEGKFDNLKNPKDYTWFYKPHPSYNAKDMLDRMQTTFPNIQEIPAQIPFEVLILAGLKPTLTAGFGSSLFYSLNSRDVLYYARRWGDSYLPFLLDNGQLKPEQVVNYNSLYKAK